MGGEEDEALINTLSSARRWTAEEDSEPPHRNGSSIAL